MTKTRKTKRHIVNLELLKDMMRQLPQVPEGTSGNYSVVHEVHEAGKPMTVVSMRNAIMMNQQPTELVLDHPHTIRYLKEGTGIWMSDTPQEVYQMREPLARLHGSVLVGGLGLGVFAHLAIAQPKVDSVVTVERSPDVIELVADHIIGATIQDDLFEFLKSVNWIDFDCAFFDIWAGTGEFTWAEYVVPLRRLCRGRISQSQVFCWNEEEMKGQLREGLRRAAYYDCKTVAYYEPLRIVAQNLLITHPQLNSRRMPRNDYELKAWWEIGKDNHTLARLIERYLSPGTTTWEQDFGQLWDRFVPKGEH